MVKLLMKTYNTFNERNSNNSLIFSDREEVLSEEGEIRGVSGQQDTTFTTTDEISEVDFILY